MCPIRYILPVLLTLGIISAGCTTKQSDQSNDKGEINLVDRSGRKQGPWEIYEDSVLIARGEFTNGKPDGLWTYWYPDGMMKEEGHYKQGEKNGMWVQWYPDGDLMWKGEWKNGTRHIGYPDARAEIKFIGQVPEEGVLVHDSTYRVRIRIINIPSENLFVETSTGTITREEGSELFILKTTHDTSLTLAIGYIPSLEFMDFRNLVTEIDFTIK